MLSSEDNDLVKADDLPEPAAYLGDIPQAHHVLAELGEGDFTAADYFEAYANAIERQAEEQEQARRRISPQARQALLDLLTYFEDPSTDYRDWPQQGLRIMAMLAPVSVASGLLGVRPELLQLSILTRMNAAYLHRTWAWRRELGEAIQGGASDQEIAAEFNLTPRAVSRFVTALIGPDRKAA